MTVTAWDATDPYRYVEGHTYRGRIVSERVIWRIKPARQRVVRA